MTSALVLGALSLAAGIVGFIRPGFRLAAATTWGLTVLVYGLIWSAMQIRGMVARGRSPYDKIRQPPVSRKMRPADLVRCERIFGRKVYTPGDFDHSVRPLLRTLIRHRSARRAVGAGNATTGAAPLDHELSRIMGQTPAETLYGRDLVTADIDRMLQRIEAM